MGIVIALALISAILFAATVVIRTFVGVIGGAAPEWQPLRRVSQFGEAKLAVAGIDREYRQLLRS